jgi:hypothetical protein
MEKNKPLNIHDRLVAPTPPFFKRLSKYGRRISGFGIGLLLTPVDLPEIVTKAGSYMVAVGTAIYAVSELAVPQDTTPEEES